MEPREYLDILRRRWFSVLAIAITTLAMASVVTLAMPKKYTATTRLFFAVASDNVSDLAQGSSFAEKQMASYAQVATSPLVLDPVARELGLQITAVELARRVEATVPADTVILEIAATQSEFGLLRLQRASPLIGTPGLRPCEQPRWQSRRSPPRHRHQTLRATSVLGS
jgi:succinoglycan biosynthesis transport protein ExoP